MKSINKNKIISITIIAFIIALMFSNPLSFKIGYLIGSAEKNVVAIYKSYILNNEEVKPDNTVSIMAEVSAYTSNVAETDSAPCRNAFGNNICNLHKAGLRIIACPVEYRPDQLIGVEGIIYACFDRMNQEKYPDSFDIYYGYDRQKALDFGRKKLEIEIIN